MKTLLCVIMVLGTSVASFASDCSSGQCHRPVRTIVKQTTKIATAPVRVTKQFVNNSQCRRYNRRCR